MNVILLAAVLSGGGCSRPEPPTEAQIRSLIEGATEVRVSFENLMFRPDHFAGSLRVSDPDELRDLASHFAFVGDWNRRTRSRSFPIGAAVEVVHDGAVVFRFFANIPSRANQRNFQCRMEGFTWYRELDEDFFYHLCALARAAARRRTGDSSQMGLEGQ